MVFEPVLDTACVEIVLDVAGQRHHWLFRLKFSKTDAALILIRQYLRRPLDSKHLLQHRGAPPLVLSLQLRLLEPLVERVGDEASEHYCSQDEHYRWEGTDYQDHMVNQFDYRNRGFAAGRRCLHHSEEVFECPEAECSVPVEAKSE